VKTGLPEFSWQLFFLAISLLSSFLMVLLVQKIKKPQLEMRIGDYSLHDQNSMKIVHIRVRNRPVKYLSRFMNRDFATNCRAHIKVRDASTCQLIKEFHELKWASNPEPLKYEWKGEGAWAIMQDPALMMTAGVKNLGERWEDLDIAVKREHDQEFYVNTPHNYPLNLKPRETRVDARRCFIDVIIDYDNGVSEQKRFYLRNDSTRIMDFELSGKPL